MAKPRTFDKLGYEGEAPMTDQRRQAIRESAHRLRSRLTYLLLCSHGLRSDLRGKLTHNELAEFQQLANVLEETKAVLQALLKELEPELRARVTKPDDVQMIGLSTASENAAS
jgi:hypothetical protein